MNTKASLQVEYRHQLIFTKHTDGSGEFGKKDTSEGWYITVDGLSIPMAFARKNDAETALKSIEGIIDWDGESGEIFDRLKAFGLRNLRAKLTECLAW